MTTTRRAVFEQLAAASDAATGRTTTVDALAAALGAEEAAVAAHVEALVACELARRVAGGEVRVTITGEELLALGVDDLAIVAPPPADPE